MATKVFVEEVDRPPVVIPIARSLSKDIPDWVTCDAKFFERVWLPRFENGEMPPCTDEDWQKIQNAFHSDETPTE